MLPTDISLRRRSNGYLNRQTHDHHLQTRDSALHPVWDCQYGLPGCSFLLKEDDYNNGATWTYSVDVATPYGRYISDLWDTEIDWDEGQLGYDVVNQWGDNARFFGVSALGAMTNENLQIDIPEKQEVKPFRVMDPLIWVLHKLGGFGIPVEQ